MPPLSGLRLSVLPRSAAPLSVLRLSGKRVSPPWLPRLQSLPQLLLCAASGEYGRYGGDRSSAGDACEATLRRAEAAPCCEAVLEALSAEDPGRPPPLALRPKLDARRSSLRRLADASIASCAACSVTSSSGRPEPPPSGCSSSLPAHLGPTSRVPDSRLASRRSSRSRRLSCSSAASTDARVRAGDEIALPTPPGRLRLSREFSSGGRPIVGDRPGDWAWMASCARRSSEWTPAGRR